MRLIRFDVGTMGPSGLMFCIACRRYRQPEHARPPDACAACGGVTIQPARTTLADDLARLRYLEHELRTWARTGLIDEATRDRLLAPYLEDAALAQQYLDDEAAPVSPAPVPVVEVVAAIAVVPAAAPGEVVPVVAVAELVEPVGVPAAPAPSPAPPAPPGPPPREDPRLLRELRPVFYENLVLLLGAFLVFAGSVYFAIYFWDRLGSVGPLVAGSLLAGYASSFAGTGYLVQRRYHADLSARVLYAIATTILPVAVTLLGQPLAGGGLGLSVLAGAAVTLISVLAYPALWVAASLFQREVGRPFARSFVVMLLAIGWAPLVAHHLPRPVGLLFLYLATLPLLVMYRQIRGIGWVFERATVVYVVGGSAYALLAVATRTSLALEPVLRPAELAPLLVLIATAAIDLDVSWRARAHAVRTTLGAVGVLAHGAAVLAVALAALHPGWRLVTTLATGLLFAVAALRHQRAQALHLALLALAASAVMVLWLPGFSPPRGVAFAGVLLLPLALGTAHLAARWRRHGAIEFARICEVWTVACAVGAALMALGLPRLGPGWTAAALGSLAPRLPALVMLPATAAALALAWRWTRRRGLLGLAVLAAASTVVLLAGMAGAGLATLAATTAGLGLMVALAAAAAGRRGHADAQLGLVDAAMVLAGIGFLATVAAHLGGWPGPDLAPRMLAGVLVAAAAIAVSAQIPRRALDVLAVLALATSCAAALAPVVPLALLAGVLALGLFALDARLRDAVIGAARPFADAWWIAIAATAVQAFHLAETTARLATLASLEATLVAAACFIVAARRSRAWPTYLGLGFLAAAAYGLPAALALDVRPRTVVKACGLAVVAVALLLRAWPRLVRWRTTFLDVPLHLAAIGVPIAWFRPLTLLGTLGDDGSVGSSRLLRALGSALALATLAALVHGSILHAYLAAAALALLAPAAAAALGLSTAAVAPAFAVSALVMLAAAHLARRSRWLRGAVRAGDRPLALFGRWRLPAAASHGALWAPPLARTSALAALAALVLVAGAPVLAGPALALVLLVGYALWRWLAPAPAEHPWIARARLWVHAACAGMVALAGALCQLAEMTTTIVAGAAVMGCLFWFVGEVLARTPWARTRDGARGFLAWSVLLPLIAVAAGAPRDVPLAGLGAVLLALTVTRYRGRYHADRIRLAPSVATMVAAGLVVRGLLVRSGWAEPTAVTLAALALTASLGAWAHWGLRRRVGLGAPRAYASGWALVAAALALASAGAGAPLAASAVVTAAVGLTALGLVTVWFGFAAVDTGRAQHGHPALAGLILVYLHVRIGPFGAGLNAGLDASLAVGAAFLLHLATEVLGRGRLAALAGSARAGARVLPAVATAVLAVAVANGAPGVTTLVLVVLAEAIGLIYALGHRGGGHPLLGLAAAVSCNAGLLLLAQRSDLRDALFYTIPTGVSIVVLARLYRAHLDPGASRALRTLGCLLIYVSGFYQALQFDGGSPALVLGGLTLVGVGLGFALQLRDLFLLSVGFTVLNVLSNLAYYGVHRPLLGWTILTLTGLGLTASGVLFQLRRARLRAWIARTRALLRRWD